MRRPARAAIVLAMLAGAAPCLAQMRVNPTGVNVAGQSPTTVLLTFAPLAGYTAVEATWCGELIPAAPEIGRRCAPSTIFGSLPLRYDLSQPGPADSFMDVMSVPASVARRAYDAAAAGGGAEFFYVRQFVKPGFPAQFVAVTCRLTAGGARVPLSLVDVRLAFANDARVAYLASGAALPRVSADLQYTGTGRLVGRWEIVAPGQEAPEPRDLLPEGSLAPAARSSQRRYTEVDRFNVFLPAGGRYTLAGPDPAKLPTTVAGAYLVLLRIEASDEKESDTDLSALGVADAVVHAGGLAGFPMPVLRYVVGGDASAASAVTRGGDGDLAAHAAGAAIELVWQPVENAAYYRVSIQVSGRLVHEALQPPGVVSYALPPFVAARIAAGAMRWRLTAVDASGRQRVIVNWTEVDRRGR